MREARCSASSPLIMIDREEGPNSESTAKVVNDELLTFYARSINDL